MTTTRTATQVYDTWSREDYIAAAQTVTAAQTRLNILVEWAEPTDEIASGIRNLAQAMATAHRDQELTVADLTHLTGESEAVTVRLMNQGYELLG